jgi:hypothetical protein
VTAHRRPGGDCLDCGEGTEHCHAAWIRHPDGHEECLVVTCSLGSESHAVMVLCGEVDVACCA